MAFSISAETEHRRCSLESSTEDLGIMSAIGNNASDENPNAGVHSPNCRSQPSFGDTSILAFDSGTSIVPPSFNNPSVNLLSISVSPSFDVANDFPRQTTMLGDARGHVQNVEPVNNTSSNEGNSAFDQHPLAEIPEKPDNDAFDSPELIAFPLPPENSVSAAPQGEQQQSPSYNPIESLRDAGLDSPQDHVAINLSHIALSNFSQQINATDTSNSGGLDFSVMDFQPVVPLQEESAKRHVDMSNPQTAGEPPIGPQKLSSPSRAVSNDGAENNDEIYGKLVVLGRNGAVDGPEQFYFRQRQTANGLSESTGQISSRGAAQSESSHSGHHFNTSAIAVGMRDQAAFQNNLNHPKASNAHRHDDKDSNRHHSQIIFRVQGKRDQTIQFSTDSGIDMFQIGRATNCVDMIVNQEKLESNGTSMVSRYACRITVSRQPPYISKIYAAGFDESSKIFLGENAKVWHLQNGRIDGLTTNGVLICKNPQAAVQCSSSVEQMTHWREVSVRGNIYPYKVGRYINEFDIIDGEDNVLVDGTLIDLAGVVLLWRSREGVLQSLNDHKELSLQANLNAQHAICPVLYKNLQIKPAVGPPAPGHVFNSSLMPHLMRRGAPSGNGSRGAVGVAEDELPYLYTECGHVSSNINWGQQGPIAGGVQCLNVYKCPVCRKFGPRLRFRVGSEPSFWRESQPEVTHAFTRCAHGVSEETAKFWSTLILPRENVAMCPFCGEKMPKETPYIRLFLQIQDADNNESSNNGDNNNTAKDQDQDADQPEAGHEHTTD